jgi:tetratricopeptide (TPR) repeat protein
LRTLRSSFLKNELLILLLLTYPLLSTGCGQKSVWGLPVEGLKDNLARADYSALSGLDFKSEDPSRALDLGPSAPYYLFFVFDGLKKPEAARSMLELAWDRSPRPWKEEAGLALADRYLAEKDYEKALKTARGLVSLLGKAPQAERARRDLVEALYWGKADSEVLGQLGSLTAWDAELSLFRAVSSLRLNRAEAHDLFVDLFLREKGSGVHARAYLFLSADPASMSLFSDWEKDLLVAKYALQQGDWTKGIPLMEGVVTRMDPPRLDGSLLVGELGAAYIPAGMSSRGAAFMEKLSRTLTGDAMLDALETAGKCSRRVQDYGKALADFRAVAAGTRDAERQDRARWFILDILLKTNPPGLMDQIGRESSLWNDPGYFSDLLEDKICSLVAERRWRDLILLEAALETSGSKPVRAQLAYILARALREKLILRVAGNPDKSYEALLRLTRDADPDGYYGMLAAGMLGELPGALGYAMDLPGPQPAQPEAETPPLDPLIDGFISFGLTSRAFDAIWGRRGEMSDALIAAYSRRLAAAGDSREAMNLMAYLGSRRMLSASEMRILYPKPYSSIVEELASHSLFPAWFVYGMVREESYFDPDIVSSAGAVGLAQLMPATAGDVARSLKMDAPDLTDPRTSLTLGLRHLEGLLGRVGNLPTALLSYNAGLSRSRSWSRQGGGLATDLFVEAVPYEESRTYVRKIIVSTVIYAYLYQNQDPRETLKTFYPEAFAAASKGGGPLQPY